MKTAGRALTAYDYREMPEGPPYYQLIEGDLETSPGPNRYHQKVVNNVAYLLRSYLEQNPAGEVYFAPFDVYLTDLNVYQPDVVYVASARKAILTDRGGEGAPDLVVEVLSLKTARLDKGIKREGCSHAAN